jgi:DNA-binding SARP family transcriptional activator
VQVLGGFSVSVDGELVPAEAWRTRRAADLVKLLALEPGHALHRERVLDRLWPELDEEAAGGNLRKAIHYARRAMSAPESVSSRNGMVGLWDGDVDVDVDRFLALLNAAQRAGSAPAHASAAGAYSGDALPADRYEPWAAAARERLRERHLEALKGAHIWERVLELDPTDEESHRALMRRHYDEGRRREALRQFERLRDALREYVGVGPDTDTIAIYERVLAMEGAEPPTPAQRAAQLIATGLVSFNRGEFADAEQRARDAREIAVAAQLAHEVGDASTLLALTALWSARWQEVFQEDFAASLHQSTPLAREIFDAHLCFVEYHVAGVDGFAAAEYARNLLSQANAARSPLGQGVAQLMLGESLLLAGDLDGAALELQRAAEVNQSAGSLSGVALSLEHAAELDIAQNRKRSARTRLNEAFDIAQRSSMPSHLVVRVLGVKVRAAEHGARALAAVSEAERVLADANRVCDPCSINFHLQATAACARNRDLSRARAHLAIAERIAGLWHGGPWSASVWEARAAVRLAEGERTQADALLREAADAFDGMKRPADAARCLAAIAPAT